MTVPEASTPETDVDVIVVGAGVAGLVAARDLLRRGFTVRVLEGSGRIGGTVGGHVVAGLRLDAGAESFAVRGGSVAALLADLGLSADVVAPRPLGSWVQLAGRAAPMPRTGLLGIPSSPLASDVAAVIGWPAAFRAFLDRLRPPLTIGRERSLGRLVRTRMGRAVLERLVAPVAGGVYSADPDDLDVDVVAPGLSGALTRTGSLSGAIAALRESAPPGAAVAGLRGGMHRMLEALVADIERRGGEIRTDSPVLALLAGTTDPGSEAHDWTVVTRRAEGADADAEVAHGSGDPGAETLRGSGGPSAEGLRDAGGPGAETLRARAVVLATSASSTLALLGSATGADLATATGPWPSPTSVELATLVVEGVAGLDDFPRGTGVLVAAEARGVAAKALTHASAKWEWVGEAAGAGRHVLRLSYGRARTAVGPAAPATEDLDDRAFAELARRDASSLLGVDIPPASVIGTARTPWTNALPFAALGHRDRVAAVREVAEGLPNLAVTGAWASGSGLASVVPDALRAAGSIRRLDFTDHGETGAEGLPLG